MKRRALLLSGCCLSLVGACQSSSVDAQQTTTINAVVETVDPISRELLLRGAGGAQSGRFAERDCRAHTSSVSIRSIQGTVSR